MSLIVIQGHDAVVSSLKSQMEYGICSDRAFYLVSHSFQLLYRRIDCLYLFVSKKPVFAAVRVQPGDRHNTVLNSQLAQHLLASDHIIDDPLFCNGVAGVSQAHMPGKEKDSHVSHFKDRKRVRRACKGPEYFRMADIGDPCCPQGFFIDRRSTDCPCFFIHCQPDRPLNIFIGGLAALSADLPHLIFFRSQVMKIDHI